VKHIDAALEELYDTRYQTRGGSFDAIMARFDLTDREDVLRHCRMHLRVG
jgi:hypothetical protein